MSNASLFNEYFPKEKKQESSKKTTKNNNKELFNSYFSETPKTQEPKVVKSKNNEVFDSYFPEWVGTGVDEFTEGMKESATGQTLGYEAKPSDGSLWGETARMGGAFLADSPLMGLGSFAGPGGMLGLPAFVGSLNRAIRTPMPKDADAFDYISRAGTVGKDTVKGVVTGKLMSFLSPLLSRGFQGLLGKAGEKVGGIAAKTLTSKPAKAVASYAGEVAGLTGAETVAQMELPTKRDLLRSAIMVGGLKTARAVSGSKSVKAIAEKTGLTAAKRSASAFANKLLEKTGVPEKVRRAFWRKDVQKDVLKAYDEMRSNIKGKKSDLKFEIRETYLKRKDGIKFTNENLKDSPYYIQKTGNPHIKGDTFEAVKKRLPQKVRNILDTEVKNSFDTWMKEVNALAILKNITPREVIARGYLPGIYEKGGKSNSEVLKLQRDASVKDSVFEKKQFKNYHDAYMYGGKEAKYKNINDLHTVHGEKMIELIETGKFHEKLNKLQGKTGLQEVKQKDRIAESDKKLTKEVKGKQKERAVKKAKFKPKEVAKEVHKEIYPEEKQAERIKGIKELSEKTGKKISKKLGIEEEPKPVKTEPVKAKPVKVEKPKAVPVKTVPVEKLSTKEILKKIDPLKINELDLKTRESTVKDAASDLRRIAKRDSSLLSKAQRDYARSRTPENAQNIKDRRLEYKKTYGDYAEAQKDLNKIQKEISVEKKLLKQEEVLAKKLIKEQYKEDISKQTELTNKYLETEKKTNERALKLAKSYATKEQTRGIALNESNLKKALKHNARAIKIKDSLAEAKRTNIRLNQGDVLKNQIFVTSDDPIGVAEARERRWPRYEDKLLRSMDSNGALRDYFVSEEVWVNPDASAILQGVYKVKNKEIGFTGRTVDAIANTARATRVMFSPFHYGALLESFFGVFGHKGFGKVFQLGNKGMGESLLTDKDYSRKMARSHLETGEYSSGDVKRGVRGLEAAAEWIKDKVPEKISNSKIANSAGTRLAKKTVNTIVRGHTYLFRKFHPRMKALAFKELTERIQERRAKAGEKLTPELIEKCDKQAAQQVNDNFGGQSWDMTPVLNSPTYRKFLYRAMGFPDWTTSAARQAANSLLPGVKGDVARQYWMTFGVTQMVYHTAVRAALNTIFKTDDPTRSWQIPIGKDADGRMLYIHGGKQALEIEGWIAHPVNEFYKKMNAIPQTLFEQLSGVSIGEGDNWVVQGAYKKGKKGLRPWDGTDPGTLGNMASRLRHAAKQFVPFSLRAAYDKGGKAILKSGLGMFPISTGASPNKAHPYLVKAFVTNDTTLKNRIIKALKDNNYKSKQIRAAITMARTEARSTVPKRIRSF